MVMIPVGIGTKNDSAGEDQQQFTESTDSRSYEFYLLGYNAV
jgi:hypothetical protein